MVLAHTNNKLFVALHTSVLLNSNMPTQSFVFIGFLTAFWLYLENIIDWKFLSAVYFHLGINSLDVLIHIYNLPVLTRA